MSIMRLWHGEVPIEKADEYQAFMVSKAAPDYASINGLINLYFQRRDEQEKAHFLLVTIWDSMQSIKEFAGDQPELAKYYLEDDDFLLEKEKFTTMYDIFYQQ
ncbi:MAG: antibiotic biosynthesis monooxygenase [bacterium]